MPKQLTEDQKAARVTITKEHLVYFHRDEKFFYLYCHWGQLWVHYAEPETKTLTVKAWKWAASPPLKKLKLSPSACKVMLVVFCFFYSHGIIMAHFMPKGQTVTVRYYSKEILKKKNTKLKKLRPRLAQKNAILLHDNAPSHTASVEYSRTCQLLQKAIVVPPKPQFNCCPTYPPYSPDLAPWDLFSGLKTNWKQIRD